MKKISLILVLTILCSLFSVFTPATASAATLGAEEMNLLLCLGAEAEKELDEVLTVGDFAKLLAASIFNPEDYLMDGADVSDEKLIEYSILALNKHGILEDGIDVSQTLDFDITIKALVNMLGFGQVAKTLGYKVQAAELGILKGVYPADESAVTMGEAVVMIYNSLFINLLEMSYLTNPGMEYTQSNVETILTKNRDIYRYKGFLYDNGVTNVTGISTVPENSVKIGDLIMDIGKTNITDYLAYYVDVFYTDTGDDYIIKCFRVTEKENNIVYISGDDIEPNSTLTSIEYVDEGKTRLLNVSAQASYIYNGTWTLSLTDNDIKSANGGVTLVDVDFNNVYDIVMVDSFKNIVVREVVAEDFVVIGLYEGLSYTNAQGSVLTYNDTHNFGANYDEDEILVYRNGVEVSFSEITPYDMLAVYEGDSYLKIEIFTYAENAKIKSASDEGITTDEGKEFRFGPEYASLAKTKRPSAGMVGTLYFGKNGDIVYFEEKVSNATVVGYLHKMYYDTDEEQAYMRVFTEDGNWVKLSFCDKVYINDTRKEEKDLNLDPMFFNADGSTDRQLLQYTIDIAGEVKKIYTTASTRDDSIKVSDESGQFYYSNVTGGYGSFIYGSVGITDFQSASFYVESNTTLFRIPADESQESVYRVYKNGSLPYTHGNYPDGVTGYYATMESKKKATVDYIVQEMTASDPSFDHRASVVVDFGEMLDETDTIQKFITVLYNGEEKTYYSMNGEEFNGIQTGDVIQLWLFNEQVMGYRKIFSVKAKLASSDIINGGYAASDLEEYYDMNDADTLIDSRVFIDSTKTVNSSWYAKSCWYGTIDYKSGNYMTLRLGDGSLKKLRAGENVASSYYKTMVYVYDEKTDTVRKGSVKDIYSGSKVFTYVEGALMQDILVVKTK